MERLTTDRINNNQKPGPSRRSFLGGVTAGVLFPDKSLGSKKEKLPLVDRPVFILRSLMDIGYKIRFNQNIVFNVGYGGFKGSDPHIKKFEIMIRSIMFELSSYSSIFTNPIDDLIDDSTNMEFINSFQFDTVNIDPSRISPDLNIKGREIVFSPVYFEISFKSQKDGVFEYEFILKNSLTNEIYYQKTIKLCLDEDFSKKDEFLETVAFLKEFQEKLKRREINLVDEFRSLNNKVREVAKVDRSEVSVYTKGKDFDQQEFDCFWDENFFSINYFVDQTPNNVVSKKGQDGNERVLVKNSIKKPEGPIFIDGDVWVLNVVLPKNRQLAQCEFIDKYGNYIKVYTQKILNDGLEDDYTCLSIIIRPSFTEDEGGNTVPINIDLSRIGLDIPNFLFQKTTPFVFEIDGLKIYSKDRKLANHLRKEISFFVKGVRQAERLFGFSPGSFVKKVKLSSSGKNAFVMSNMTDFVNVSVDLINYYNSVGKINPVDSIFNLGMHETFHSILMNLFSKNQSLENQNLKDFLLTLNPSFFKELAEGLFIPAQYESAGHPWDNLDEFIATFLVVATHRLTPDVLKLKNDKFKELFFKSAHMILSYLPFDPNTPIFNILNQYAHQYSPSL